MHRPFTVYRRSTTRKKRYVYYIQFRDEDGNRMTAVSSGKTTRAEAERWAYNKLKDGYVPSVKEPKFKVYAQNWFIWDRCDYLLRKRNRGDYSRSYAEQQRGYLENHILPHFGDTKLCSITITEIENWNMKLKNQYSPVTANRVLTVLKIMLKEAKRRRLISYNPGEDVEKLPETSKEKGILTLLEFHSLFNPQKFEHVWNRSLFHYTLNILTSVTGLRLGEIQAIRWCCINKNFIEIDRSWDRKYGLKEPKAKSSRSVSIPSVIFDCLCMLQDLDRFSDPNIFVFHGDDLFRPIDHKVISKRLYNALECIGISDCERRSRNLTFHSWRHFLNTNLRTLVADADLQKITGHRTIAMTEHYDHETEQSLARVQPHQENLLGIRKGSLLALSV